LSWLYLAFQIGKIILLLSISFLFMGRDLTMTLTVSVDFTLDILNEVKVPLLNINYQKTTF
jgi:hypothetical protein